MPLRYSGTPKFLEPGHQFVLTEDTYLFTVAENATDRHRFYGHQVHRKLLPKGTRIFATRLSRNPGPLAHSLEAETARIIYDNKLEEEYCYAATYRIKSKQGSGPGSGRAVEFLEKGFLSAKCLAYAGQRFVLTNRNIYATANEPNNTQPKIEHIHQGAIGNCFFLAAVTALLIAKGSDYVESMMVQEGNTTVVRLFNPHTQEPVYIRVENSRLEEDGENFTRHPADWPIILEKALAGYAKTVNANQEFISTFPAYEAVYGVGGQAATAFKLLTGEESDTVELERTVPWDSSSVTEACLIADMYATMLATLNDETLALETANRKIQEVKQTSVLLTLLDTPPLVLAWAQFYKFHQENWDKYVPPGLMLNSGEFNNQLRCLSTLRRPDGINHSDLETVFDRFRQELFTVDREMLGSTDDSTVVKVPRYPIAEESHLYTHQQLALYNKLKTAYDETDENNNRINVITVSMGNKLENGTSSFHQPVKGLFASHAYSVESVYEDPVSHVKYVVIRNPHGHTGRGFHYLNPDVGFWRESRVVSHAFSQLTLDEFYKFASGYVICKLEQDLPALENTDFSAPSDTITANEDAHLRDEQATQLGSHSQLTSSRQIASPYSINSDLIDNVPSIDLENDDEAELCDENGLPTSSFETLFPLLDKSIQAQFTKQQAEHIARDKIHHLMQALKSEQQSCLGFLNYHLKKAKYQQLKTINDNLTAYPVSALIQNAKKNPNFVSGQDSRVARLCDELVENERKVVAIEKYGLLNAFRLGAQSEIDQMIKTLKEEIARMKQSCFVLFKTRLIQLKTDKIDGLTEIRSRLQSAIDNQSKETLKEIISQARYIHVNLFDGLPSRTKQLCDKLLQAEEKNGLTCFQQRSRLALS